MIVQGADERSDGERKRRRRRKGGGGKEGGGGGEGEEEEEMPTEAVAAAAVTSRLVFLITPDPGRAEEEELLSDVSIMTRLCTEVRIVYPARKTSTAQREDEGGSAAASSYTPRGTSRPGSRVETVRRDKESAI